MRGRGVGKLMVFLGLYATSCYADLDSGSLGQEKMMQPPEKSRCRPFNIDGSFDTIGASPFTSLPFKGQKQSFSQGEIEAGFVFYFKECFEEALQITIGGTDAHFVWQENPFFDQTHFYYVSLELGGRTKRFRNWLWQGNVSVNVNPNHFDFKRYANYDLLLWGRREWSNRWGWHLGVLSFLGMEVNRVYPIFGFDWKITSKWTLNAIYPINIALVYEFNKYWSAAAAGRFFFNRFRTGENEPLPRAVFEYRNRGAELAITYTKEEIVSVNLHGGITFNADIGIANSHYTNRHTYCSKTAPYLGAQVDFRF